MVYITLPRMVLLQHTYTQTRTHRCTATPSTHAPQLSLYHLPCLSPPRPSKSSSHLRPISTPLATEDGLYRYNCRLPTHLPLSLPIRVRIKARVGSSYVNLCARLAQVSRTESDTPWPLSPFYVPLSPVHHLPCPGSFSRPSSLAFFFPLLFYLPPTHITSTRQTVGGRV